MKKRISFTTQGESANIGECFIQRILPNRYTDAIGPFDFLDHLLLANYLTDEPLRRINNTVRYSTRGVKTLTYVLNDEVENANSTGDQTIISRRAKRMKEGNDTFAFELAIGEDYENKFLAHALQFCIDFPSNQENSSSKNHSIEANEVAKQMLTDNRGWIKLVLGEYENLVGRVSGHSKQFLYHIHLEPGKQISTKTEDGLEYAIFLPKHDAIINDIECMKGEVIEFEKKEGTIEISNACNVAIDIIIFGGENKRNLR